MKKNEKLIEVLGEVDDSLIPEEKENIKKAKKSPIKLISAIGGVCAAAAIGIFAFNNLGLFNNEIETEPDTTTGITETTEPVTDISVTETEGITTVPTEEGEIAYTRKRKSTVISEITADSKSGESILTNSSFTIKSFADLSVSELMGKLSITPEVDYSVTKKADCEYILTANTAFEKGSVVKLSVISEEGGTGDCWAFRTVDDFRVKSVYPADGAEYVSVDSGIEITFSEPVDLSTVESRFSTEPSIKGRFEVNNNTLYFIPEEDMSYKTVYRVTLSEGIKSMNGNDMKDSFSFSFCTTARYESFYTYNGISETFIMGDPVVIEIQGNENSLSSEFDVKLYKYGNSDDYISDLMSYNSESVMSIDEGRMKEIFSSFEVAKKRDSYWLPRMIMLPYDLEEGYYVASITKGEDTIYYFIEMNPISVYSASLGDNTAFFVNDTNTGKAASGAEIILHTSKGDFSAKTDNNGVARISTKDNAFRSDIIEINYGGHRYIDLLMNYREYKVGYKDLYYTYIYTDREAYQTTDTMNIWGIIKPRREGVRLPDNLLVCFGEGETGGKTVKLTPSADGTFTASISFEDRAKTYGARVSLLDGDKDNAVICSKSVQIMDYVKPTYTFDVTVPDYVVMPQKNPFDVTVDAHYFDGTPASKLTFEVNREICSGSSTTDENGIAAMKLKSDDNSSWVPSNIWVDFGLTGIENNYQYFGKAIYGFYRDVMLQSEYDKDKKTYTVNTNKIDFSKIPEFMASEKDYYSSDEGYYDVLKGNPYDTEVTVNISRSWYERVETGSYYDFIEKRTVKSYNYEYCTEDIGTYTVNTVNGIGVIENLSLDKEGSSYSITISYSDSLGQRVECYDGVYNGMSYKLYTDYRMFRLDASAESDDERREFHEDENIEFTLKEYYDTNNGDPEGKIFFITSQNDIIDAKVYDSTTFTYKADKRCIPDFNYCGAYFDGRHVYPISPDSISFDPGERKIKLEISSDKEKYDAGEEVTLTVYAKDIYGKPVRNATVSLSVVDEAAFAVREQYVDTLGSLYSYIWYSYPYQNCSYIQHVMNGEPGAEKGGGEPDNNVRKDFRDNPYFGSVNTDENGKAVFKFKLADSITTWRATVQSVCEINGRMFAGSDKTPIIATRPVFVTPIMLSEYTAGDDISVTAKCVGLKDMDKISVTLSGNGEDRTVDILPTETADFGKLPVGEYTVTFRASNGINSDAIEMPLSVVETKQEVLISKDISLDEINSISPTNWPVSMIFYDKEYEFCKEILENLSCYFGDRTDMKAASAFALAELGWNEGNYSEKIQSATVSGYATLLPNGDENIKLTALLCGAFPESVSREAIINAFENTLKDCDAEDMAYCYMGLAALGKPVFGDIKRILSENGDKLTLSEKLYLTAGLAFAGDFSSAYDSYIKLTSEMKFYENEEGIRAYFIDEEHTKLALLTAAMLNLPEAEPLARGLVSREPKYDSYALELVVYLRNYVPKVSGDAEFSYTINGERKTVKLDRYGIVSLSFDKEQFNNADFKVDSGNVSLYALYTGRISEQEKAPKMSVTKTYSKTSDLNPGDVVTVTINAEPYSVIEDIIPSCARLCGETNTYYDSVGQHIRLYTGISGRAIYKICIATSGDFVTEGAYSYNYEDDGDFYWGISESGKITVDRVNEGV